MAISGSYGYTNTSKASTGFDAVVIDDSIYAIVTDEPGLCVMKNTTSPIDQPEVISYIAQEKTTISLTEQNQHPAASTNARMITVKVENLKRMTSSVDDTYITDLPLTCNITWRFARNAAFTKDDLIAILERALGAIRDSDGTGSRLDNMMMLQVNPRS